MLILRTNNRFEKELAKSIKRGKDLNKLRHVVDLLLREMVLPAKCKPHKLIGDWQGVWECHIEPDWLLVYRYNGNYLELLRTGTHSDLFG